MDGDLKGAIVERFQGNDEVDFATVVGENGGETRELRLGEDAAADQFGQDRFHVRARGRVVGAKAEHLEGLIVGQNEAAVGVHHAQAVRHVVESHVETRREHLRLLLGRHDRHEVGSQPLGVALHVKDERSDSHNDSHRIQAAGDDHRNRKRSEGAEELQVDPAIGRVAARHETERIGDRHRYAGEMRKVIVGHAEGEQSPRRERCQADDGASRKDLLPHAGDRDG